VTTASRISTTPEGWPRRPSRRWCIRSRLDFRAGGGADRCSSIRPGEGFPGRPDAATVAQYAGKAAEHHNLLDFLLDLIPDTIIGAFARGDILQVLFFFGSVRIFR